MAIKETTLTQSTGKARNKVAQTGLNNDYAALKNVIKAKGLLEKQPKFVLAEMLLNFALLGLCLAILLISDNIWVQVLNATFMAFIFTHMGFIMHDTGHRQAFRNASKNDLFGLINANLLIGLSYGGWIEKHNQHHAFPNQHGLDPDIDIPVIAFSEEDALAKRGIFRFFVKHQRLLFFPLLLFESYSLRFVSIKYLLNVKDWKYRPVEFILLLLHYGWYFGVIFYALGGWQALLFIAVHQALFGFYLASVFAPNHKGMLILPKDTDLGFLRLQVLTARNVRAHPITDYWYGGLNYQIEHHLFPAMARNNLNEAQKIIRKFCNDNRVSYYETSMINSYKEILEYLHQISAVLKLQPAPEK